ncbi:Crossover junction endonuclease MUS81 [Chlorella sorokiniana]|uniref:Crossover junction endonuclease MUS81 n=1 Tax=Chlorella sorokiniana TaxID=3076 RepID=A0A2P6TL37_CHLSO|nr:Crossover junction endonuclease MUS81 [Chlorella sorokiniana]|eukprot:PRW44966.1 Crossover junction endonuclease MUS81 [Chlorella sorokiniana]
MAGSGKGANYAEAAHAAADTVETQGGLLECVVPANNIVREFLLEVRRERMSRAIEHTDQLAGQMKRAADALVTHPFRVWDMPSAQRVKGCGPAMARILADNLWRLYPAEPPEEEELEELVRQEAALKAAAAAQRKRKKQEAAAAAAGPGALDAGLAAAAAGLPAGLAAAADVAADAAAGGKGRGSSKAAQEYIPQLGSAPYAFLLVMLQAQKGPAKQQHFGKQELIDLAEASGLSIKPINSDGSSKRQTNDGRMFKFDGWSSFRTLIKKGLAHEWSNPKKVSLTAQGFALAERLYRKEVARGAVEAMPGIPTAGPLLFQLEEADPAAAAAAAAAVPAGVLPSAALNATRQLAPRNAAAAAAVRRADAAAPAAAPPRAAAAAAAPAPSVPRAALQPTATLAAFPAAAPAAAGGQLARQLHAAVPDEDVAAMVEMGYSDRKARRALRRSLGELGLPDVGRAVELAELLESEGEDSDAEGPSGLAAPQKLVQAQQQQQPQQQHPQQQQQHPQQQQAQAQQAQRHRHAEELLPQRGWEQPPAGGEMQDRDLLLGPNPALLAGAAPGVVARQPSQAPAAALQRNDSGRSQQSQQERGPAAVPARGHIRMGSQQQPLEDSQQQGDEEAGEEYNIDRFLSQLDKRLNGGSGNNAAAALGQGLARAGSGSGSGAGSRASPSEGGTLRLQSGDLRLPPLRPDRRFGEEYEVLLVLDQREQYSRGTGQGRLSALEQHMAKMRQAGLVVEDRHLPIGDGVWIARSRLNPREEYVLDFIVERKSVQDLVSSIKNKERYEKQKYYLRRCGLRCLYYLVEGDPDQLPEVEQKMCRTAAARTEVWDGFKLLRTTDHVSTFRLYQALTQRIQALYRDCTAPAAGNGAGQLPSFAAWQARVKESGEGTVTLHDIWGVMLQGVPKLGPEATRAILLRYPTPLDLYRAYQAVSAAAEERGECGHRAAERLLRGLKTEGAKAGIGPDKAASVYNCLFKRRMAGGRARPCRRAAVRAVAASSSATAAADVGAPIEVLRKACRTKQVPSKEVIAAMQAVEAAHARQPLVQDFPAALNGTWRLVFSAPSPITMWQYIPVQEDAVIDVDAGTVDLVSVVGPLDNVFKGRCTFKQEGSRFDMDFGFSAAEAKWFGRWETKSEFAEKRKTYSFFLVTEDLAVANSSGGPQTLMYRVK